MAPAISFSQATATCENPEKVSLMTCTELNLLSFVFVVFFGEFTFNFFLIQTEKMWLLKNGIQHEMIYEVLFFFKKCFLYDKFYKKEREWDVMMGTVIERGTNV